MTEREPTNRFGHDTPRAEKTRRAERAGRTEKRRQTSTAATQRLSGNGSGTTVGRGSRNVTANGKRSATGADNVTRTAAGSYRQRIDEVLHRYLPASIMDVVISGAARRCRITDLMNLRYGQREKFVRELIRRVALFLDSDRGKRCCEDLEKLLGDAAKRPRQHSGEHTIRSEADVVKVRLQTIAFVRGWGGSSLACTRAATVVSELARNIALYVGQGTIKLRISGGDLEITAVDKGPGIPHLDTVLSGNYRSKHGLGLGLRGVKKLAETFEINTRVGRGTTVTALLRLK
jgi:serine/threonine-protein kinase RsbT